MGKSTSLDIPFDEKAEILKAVKGSYDKALNKAFSSKSDRYRQLFKLADHELLGRASACAADYIRADMPTSRHAISLRDGANDALIKQGSIDELGIILTVLNERALFNVGGPWERLSQARAKTLKEMAELREIPNNITFIEALEKKLKRISYEMTVSHELEDALKSRTKNKVMSEFVRHRSNIANYAIIEYNKLMSKESTVKQEQMYKKEARETMLLAIYVLQTGARDLDGSTLALRKEPIVFKGKEGSTESERQATINTFMDVIIGAKMHGIEEENLIWILKRSDKLLNLRSDRIVCNCGECAGYVHKPRTAI
ncbi:MAG TPA: hypothetical protein VMV00_01800 [Candidatus Baltobacteraceae bacterium]|nr:hypothetical protein [Candidatus Baltobacteraceae bacterium]